jgi:transposase
VAPEALAIIESLRAQQVALEAHLAETIAKNTEQIEELTGERDRVIGERDRYRELYGKLIEQCRKLELGILGQKSERFVGHPDQLTLSMLEMLLGEAQKKVEPPQIEIAAHQRPKPTGRKPLPEHLPRFDVTLLPEEVEREGLDAFERIGEEVTETVERRPGAFVVVRVHRPKFVRKGHSPLGETKVSQMSALELPIPRGLAGPGLLADTLVRRFQDHQPLHRLERIYGREGLELARSTVCGWHTELSDLVRPLIEAMWQDALASPYLCTDATGVLVQDLKRCHVGHFWIMAAPERHVLFNYSRRHDKAAVDEMLSGYEGYLVADAHSVYEHLYRTGNVIEVGCWAHARRYFFKALETDRDLATQGLSRIRALFDLERTHATLPPEARLRARNEQGKRIVEDFFGWCEAEILRALDETPIQKALRYALNQRLALSRFLEDGRLPIHNNFSERELRREAVGRKNWLFIGSDDAGEVNANFVSLIASAQLHDLEPWAYLRDLFCLLPAWPKKRVLDLAPLNWTKTTEQPAVQAALLANAYRRAILG